MKTAAQTAAAKLDLYQIHRAEYVTPRQPVLLRVAPAHYLGIAGRGAPGGEAFEQAVRTLYGVAFAAKMLSKKAGRDYAVCKLEALLWADSGRSLTVEPKDNWSWRLLIRTPDFIGGREIEATEKLVKKERCPILKEVAPFALDEGLCVQMLYTGPYDREAATVAQMETHAASEGYRFDGPCHEIYLSDPRRVAPGKLRTILRIRLAPIN